MTWLIDTNALSELKKRKPNPGVARWFQIQPSSALHLSVLTLGELRKGICAMPDGERKDRFCGVRPQNNVTNSSIPRQTD